MSDPRKSGTASVGSPVDPEHAMGIAGSESSGRGVFLSEVDSFRYPSRVTAIFEYFATGEGGTIGILLGTFSSAAELRMEVEQKFGGYYAQGAEIWPTWLVPKGVGGLVPAVESDLIGKPLRDVGIFSYFGVFHRNLS